MDAHWKTSEPFARGPGTALHSNLWQGLRLAYFSHLSRGGDRLLDFGPRKKHAAIAGADWANSELGPILSFNGTSSDYVNTGDTTSLLSANPWMTFAVGFDFLGGSVTHTDAWAGSLTPSVGSGNVTILSRSPLSGNTVKLGVIVGDDAGNKRDWHTSGVYDLAGGPHVFSGSVDWLGGTVKMYFDGVFAASAIRSQSGTLGAITTNDLPQYLGCRNQAGSPATFNPCGIFSYQWASREWNPGEHALIGRDPFAILRTTPE